EQIRKVMRRTGKELVVKPNALELVVAGGYSQKYGARFLKRFIDKEIRTPISKAWQESNVFMVMAENNKVVVKECRNDGVKNENENSCKGAPA
ncbi:MAG: hypothetical protein HYU46_22345, partial [Deltaproteobacteria bacterium]|nr:hypothetical protein [Deltaproteobacteria bacterium]